MLFIHVCEKDKVTICQRRYLNVLLFQNAVIDGNDRHNVCTAYISLSIS